MKVEIGVEAALFPEREYINGIAVAVWSSGHLVQNQTCMSFLKQPPGDH